MEEIIIQVIGASGVLGIVSNYLVSGAKFLSTFFAEKVNARVLNASASLGGALALVLMGGEADMTAIESSLTVLAMAGIAWLVAHITHKVNGV